MSMENSVVAFYHIHMDADLGRLLETFVGICSFGSRTNLSGRTAGSAAEDV
jgi:hypothetical protein